MNPVRGEASAAPAPQVAARILVAGVGNIFLRDDGFGPEVARRLASESRLSTSDVRVVDYGIRGMHLAYDLLDDVDVLVLVDAVPAEPALLEEGGGQAGSGPGSIRVLRIRPEDLDGRAALDPHGMNPAAVLGRLRTLGGELPTTYVVGCVPEDLSEGIGLSEPVSDAVPEAVSAVVSLLARHAHLVPPVTA
ncbi:hydrogenase maturation protease [Arthrobacter bambusae]|uniref:hydrogenase maturation protease n=1 Tax=Arthrobacter bambusae TaxID=1338426 RepID=UPI00278096DB|nr:hydrogenase maturation protease [Arthrobacter bambusae]MDQ0032121.1 hydrogenase maturation protease [Arthrobacter bambusae]MDQ0100273.1 hydrogenase maturation protease [Arthrobacter bambusae]